MQTNNKNTKNQGNEELVLWGNQTDWPTFGQIKKLREEIQINQLWEEKEDITMYPEEI